MVGKKKHVKFTYYEVVSLENEEEVLYDLLQWLNKITKVNLLERKKDISGVQGRLETVAVLDTEDKSFFALNFMRMDEASDAYKAKEDKRAEHIDLEDDEYLGRNTVAVYDAKKHIILIQSNRGSYSANAIQNYINATNDGEICYFRPMIDAFDSTRCKKGIVKKIIANCVRVNEFDAENSKNFERIIDSCKELGGSTFHIEIGIGRGKDRNLNNQSAYEAVNTLLRNRTCLTTAKVAMSDDEVSGVFDLFDNLHIGEFDLKVPERGELDFLVMARNIYFVYVNKSKGE